MKLSEKQAEFAVATARLLLEASSRGYSLTYGDAYRDPRLHGDIGVKLGYGHARSCHKLRLAVDFNVFKGGALLTGPAADAAHIELHKYWESLGGAPYIQGDANHYSFAHEGMR